MDMNWRRQNVPKIEERLKKQNASGQIRAGLANVNE
jgi:hypothetical protein